MLKELWSLLIHIVAVLAGEIERAALDRFVDADKAVADWDAANDIPISWSTYGRALVGELIDAYLEYMAIAGCTPDMELVRMWEEHLTPDPYHPPPPPRRKKRPAPAGLFYFRFRYLLRFSGGSGMPFGKVLKVIE